MYVVPPRLQDLSSWPSTSSSDCPVEIWEVRTPTNNSIYWSILLSYAIVSPENSNWQSFLGNAKEIKELMAKKGIRSRELDFKRIKKQIMNFNPFKNQHSFFYNNDMTDVLRIFDLKLKRYANQMKGRDEDWNETLKLKAAARMLGCYLEVYKLDSEGNKQTIIKYFPNCQAATTKKLFIFQHTGISKKLKDNQEKIINIFSFGMTLDYVVPLRKEALSHILKRAKVDSAIISKIQREFNCDKNFLVFLLKNSKYSIIPLLYASPYIAEKLTAAGFNMDPCCSDKSEYSPFCYCLGLDSTLSLYILYNYASNNFELTDKTTRNPDQEILNALKNVQKVLLDDFVKSGKFVTLKNKEAALKSANDIIRLNQYQLSILEKINSLPHVPSNQPPNTVERVQRAKQIIIFTLEKYIEYFDFPEENSSDGRTSEELKFNNFKNYIRFSEYYENLDNYTCLLFFDNFLFLELPIYTQSFTDSVHNLFLTVFGYSLFPKCFHGVHCSKCKLSAEHCPLRFIPFCFRNNFFESSKSLLSELESTLDKRENGANSSSKKGGKSAKKDHDPNLVLSEVTSSLKFIPEIKDQFLIDRLNRYLEFAAELSFSNDYMKDVLAIERALQVIGDTLNTTDSNSIIGHLLCSSLSKSAVEEFFRIRNHCLSKYRPRTMMGKLCLENDALLFQTLQDVIKNVLRIIKPIVVSQKWRIQDYIIEKVIRKAEGIDEILCQKLKSEHSQILHFINSLFNEHKRDYKFLTKNLLNYAENQVNESKCYEQKKIGVFNTVKFLFEFLVKRCNKENNKKVIDVFEDLQKLIKDLKSQTPSGKNIKIQISTETLSKITGIVSTLRKIADEIFADVEDNPEKESDFSKLKFFFENARNFNCFTDEEMSNIVKQISEHLKKYLEAKEILKDKLKNNNCLKLEEAQKFLQDAFMTQKDKNDFAEKLISDPQKALKILETANKNENYQFKDLDDLISFANSEEGSKLLLQLDLPSDLRRKILQFMNRKLESLLDRINHLKTILIDEDEEIQSLWKWGRSDGMKAHTRFLMSQRYWRERDVRASLEMLLFDCMNILSTRASLKVLWDKTDKLFTGANLRDVLSHGSTVLETVGGLLDKDDLPSQLIDKMLDLIEDEKALRNISNLWEKSELIDLKQFQTLLMDGADKDSFLKSWMNKRSDELWKDYLPLLPLKNLPEASSCTTGPA